MATGLFMAVIICPAGMVAAADAKFDAEGDWIYVVKTEPSRPELETAFNTWYDEIDIPDVLAVSSFRRARRAVGELIPQFPDLRLNEGDGKYVALYDIASSDIDKSIIDLYVAARKMNALGRSTEALKVVEANYYRRLHQRRLQNPGLGAQKFFLVQKIICCQYEQELAEYKNWFSDQLAPRLSAESDVIDASLFVLYRVMEELAVGDDELPHLLAVFSIESSSLVPALAGLDAVLGGFRTSGPSGHRHEVRDSILYRQISDVRAEN